MFLDIDAFQIFGTEALQDDDVLVLWRRPAQQFDNFESLARFQRMDLAQEGKTAGN